MVSLTKSRKRFCGSPLPSNFFNICILYQCDRLTLGRRKNVSEGSTSFRDQDEVFLNPEANNLHQHRWLSWVIMIFHPRLLPREVSTIRLLKEMSIGQAISKARNRHTIESRRRRKHPQPCSGYGKSYQATGLKQEEENQNLNLLTQRSAFEEY
jgi:hypothetical protein